jgi:hypothetical protein
VFFMVRKSWIKLAGKPVGRHIPDRKEGLVPNPDVAHV